MKKVFGVVVLVQVLVITGLLAGVAAQPRPPIKIGFTADLTGIAAQPAKDMVNGFTMYLDEVGHQMARPQGRADRRGQPGAARRGRHQAPQARRARPRAHRGRRALRPPRLRAGAQDRGVQDPHAHHRRRLGRPHPAPEVPVGRAHRMGVEPAVAPLRRVRGQDARATRRSRSSAPTTRSRGKSSAGSRRRSRSRAARSSRSSGCRWARWTSRPTSRSCGGTPTRCSRWWPAPPRCSSSSSTRRPA